MKRLTIHQPLMRIVALATLSLAVIGLTVFAVYSDTKVKSLEHQTESVSQSSFSTLLTKSEEICINYKKLMLTKSNERAAILLFDIAKQSGALEGTLSNIPLKEAHRTTLLTFLTTSGDYANELGKKLLYKKELSSEDTKQLQEICKTYSSLAAAFYEAYENDYALLEDIDEFLPKSGKSLSIKSVLSEEYPCLNYDGAFSEHTQNKKPTGTSNKSVSKEEAKRIAKKFTKSALSFDSESSGLLPFYTFQGGEDENSFTVSVCKSGEILSYHEKSAFDGLSILPTGKKQKLLEEKATAYIKEIGYGNVKPSYTQYYDGNAVINMVPVTKEGVLLYPDFIKVWVSLERSEIVGFDAKNYLMNHKKRTISPSLSKESIKKQLSSSGLQKLSLCVIPLDNGKEACCYEAQLNVNEEIYLLYLDAKTGEEQNLLFLKQTAFGCFSK